MKRTRREALLAASGSLSLPMSVRANICTAGDEIELARQELARAGCEVSSGTVSVRAFGAKGDGLTDDDAAIEAAIRSGAKALLFPAGIYRTRGVLFSDSDKVLSVHFEPGARLQLEAGVRRIALDVQKSVFSITGICDVKSSGVVNDGFGTIGIRHGNPRVGRSYFQLDRVRIENFSGSGFISYAPVYAQVGRADIYACGMGMVFERLEGGGSACAVVVDRAYINGGRRGFSADGVSWGDIGTLILEYGGSAVSQDGALHLRQCAQLLIRNLYGEQNLRNRVFQDTTPVFLVGDMMAAKAADIVTYYGVPFDERGITSIRGNTIHTARIRPDRIGRQDLAIGKDIVVDHETEKVRFGKTTTVSDSGVLRGGNAWTTVALISGQVGDVASRKAYNYVARLHRGDGVGEFDAGTILNGVLHSHAGMTPGWMRLVNNNLQFRGAAGADLNWGLTLYSSGA